LEVKSKVGNGHMHVHSK